MADRSQNCCRTPCKTFLQYTVMFQLKFLNFHKVSSRSGAIIANVPTWSHLQQPVLCSRLQTWWGGYDGNSPSFSHILKLWILLWTLVHLAHSSAMLSWMAWPPGPLQASLHSCSGLQRSIATFPIPVPSFHTSSLIISGPHTSYHIPYPLPALTSLSCLYGDLGWLGFAMYVWSTAGPSQELVLCTGARAADQQ